jgi:hypothetical protein
MFSLHFHYENQDPAGAFVGVAALADPLGTNDGDDLIVPDLNQLVAIAFGVPSGANQRLRLDSPSLRVLGRWEAQGFNGGADADAKPDSPQSVHDLRGSPLIMVPTERIIAEADYNPTIAEAAWVAYWFADGPVKPIEGQPMRSVRVTSTVDTVAGAWTNGAITFTDPLPPGRYGIVGARFQSAGMVAVRFVFPDQAARPGVLCVDDENDQQHPMFRLGGMGLMGEFESTRIPTIDMLSISADVADILGVLDLIQVRAGPGAR